MSFPTARYARRVHVLLIAFWEIGAVGQNAPLHVDQMASKHDLAESWFREHWAAKPATQMICLKLQAVRTFRAPSTASGRHGASGASAPKTAMVVPLSDTGLKTCPHNMGAASVKVLLTRSGCRPRVAASCVATQWILCISFSAYHINVSESVQEMVCNAHGCAVDCKFDDWTEWSECSKSCSTGNRTAAKQS